MTAQRRSLDAQAISAAVEGAYRAVKGTTGGKNADYIPFLADVDPSLFGVALCLPDGTVIAQGDADTGFGVESISKVFTAMAAVTAVGADTVLRKIGADATGLPFNSILAIILENHSPSTPLVNAGAISACSLLPGDADAKWGLILDAFEGLTGTRPPLIEELYRSESATNFDNRAIAWLLKEYGRIYDDPMLSLDLYTRQCSLEVTARQLAVAAATLAMGGTNPVTGAVVCDHHEAERITSLVTTVGLYQDTGDWLYRVGIPAKSGVGGGIMAVMPGLFGIGVYSPPLDPAGNSVRGQRAVAHIMDALSLNIFSADRPTIMGD